GILQSLTASRCSTRARSFSTMESSSGGPMAPATTSPARKTLVRRNCRWNVSSLTSRSSKASTRARRRNHETEVLTTSEKPAAATRVKIYTRPRSVEGRREKGHSAKEWFHDTNPQSARRASGIPAQPDAACRFPNEDCRRQTSTRDSTKAQTKSTAGLQA